MEKTILSEVGLVIGNALNPTIELISKGITIICLLLLLLFIDTKITLIVLLLISMTYLVIYKFSSKLLKKLGEEAREANELRYKSIIETFSGIKEIKINGLEKVFVKRYSDPAQNFAKTFAKSQVMTQVPRFGIEVLHLVGYC